MNRAQPALSSPLQWPWSPETLERSRVTKRDEDTLERSSRIIRSSARSIALERSIHNETVDPLERSLHLIALSFRSIALSIRSIALSTRFIALTLRFTHTLFEPVELFLGTLVEMLHDGQPMPRTLLIAIVIAAPCIARERMRHRFVLAVPCALLPCHGIPPSR